MKYKHTKFFILFYLLSMLMMSTPLISFANKPVLVLGMPMLLTWLSGWAALSTIALIIHYCIDGKAAQTRKGA